MPFAVQPSGLQVRVISGRYYYYIITSTQYFVKSCLVLSHKDLPTYHEYLSFYVKINYALVAVDLLVLSSAILKLLSMFSDTDFRFPVLIPIPAQLSQF